MDKTIDEMMKGLKEYLEKECGLITKPEDTLNDSINVLEYFKQYLEQNEPYAENHITALTMTIDLLQSYQDW